MKVKYEAPVAVVRKQVHKALPYSIQEIGSKGDYDKWKEAQAIEAATRLLESDARNAKKLEKAVSAFMATPGVHKFMGVLIPVPAPNPTISQRITNVCVKIWRNAFPD